MTRAQWAEAVADAVEDLASAVAAIRVEQATGDYEGGPPRAERARLIELLTLDTVKLTV